MVARETGDSWQLGPLARSGVLEFFFGLSNWAHAPGFTLVCKAVHGPNRFRYSPDKINALTNSASTKLPNWLSLLSQNW